MADVVSAQLRDGNEDTTFILLVDLMMTSLGYFISIISFLFPYLMFMIWLYRC